jgi:tRNA 2-thiouridine synthesizing protein A
MMIDIHLEIDTTGLNCPIPLLRLKQGLNQITTGEVIKLITTDPAAHLDIGVFTEQTGHQIVHRVKEKSQQIFFIKKINIRS